MEEKTSKLEPIFKWVCLFLTAVIVAGGIYLWRDYRYEVTKARLDQSVIVISQLNNMLPPEMLQASKQVNEFLTQIGRGHLARQFPIQSPQSPLPTLPEPEGKETK